MADERIKELRELSRAGTVSHAPARWRTFFREALDLAEQLQARVREQAERVAEVECAVVSWKKEEAMWREDYKRIAELERECERLKKPSYSKRKSPYDASGAK